MAIDFCSNTKLSLALILANFCMKWWICSVHAILSHQRLFWAIPLIKGKRSTVHVITRLHPRVNHIPLMYLFIRYNANINRKLMKLLSLSSINRDYLPSFLVVWTNENTNLQFITAKWIIWPFKCNESGNTLIWTCANVNLTRLIRLKRNRSGR